MSDTKIFPHPSRDIQQWLQQTSFIDHLFSWGRDQLSHPADDSEDIRTELVQVRDLVAELGKSPDLQQRFFVYDKSMFTYLVNFSFPGEEEKTKQYKELVNTLFADAWPLIYKLKMHFQRPRPAMLAAVQEIDLYPFASYSDHCPAFPSMHACMADLMCAVVGNVFPDTYGMFKQLANDMATSRLYMGLCLPSDMQAGQRLAQRIFEEKEFKMKYKL